MICPQCKKQGLKSKVFNESSFSTAMAGPSYYDEDGNYHYHSPNTTTTNYYCSYNHRWTEKTKKPCPNKNCNYNKMEIDNG